MSASTSSLEHPPKIPNWVKGLFPLFPALGASVLGIYLLSGAEPDYLERIFVWQKQTLWVGLGVAVAVLVSRVPANSLIRLSPLFYALNLTALALVFIIGTTKGGARSWILFGPIGFQPSEPMKIVTVLFLARLLQCGPKSTVGFSRVVAALLAAALPAFLILRQPDLGSAIIFPPLLLAMLYGTRVKRRYLSLLLSPIWATLVLFGTIYAWTAWISGVGCWLALLILRGETRGRLALFFGLQIAFVAMVCFGVQPAWEHGLEAHQKSRLVGFIDRGGDDAREMTGAQYHLRQSLIAIASGGLTGQGRGQGLQSSHGFIPMMRTDFIFAVLAEELGFIGCLSLFGCLVFLLLGGARCSAYAATWGESAIVYGILGIWLAHIFINLGMTMGLSPIAGIPLPFVSYGGTSTLANYLCLGLLLSVRRGCRFEAPSSL